MQNAKTFSEFRNGSDDCRLPKWMKSEIQLSIADFIIECNQLLLSFLIFVIGMMGLDLFDGSMFDS